MIKNAKAALALLNLEQLEVGSGGTDVELI